MKKILEKIESFSELKIEDFAPPGKLADSIAEKKDMKATQLRKVFTTIKQIDLKLKGEKDDEKEFNDPALYMLLPQLAYAKARRFISDDFYELIKTIIGDGQKGKIKKVKDFRRFVEFMTAIVAYHKFHHTK